MKYFTLVYILFVFLNSNAFAQNNIETVNKVYKKKLIKEYKNYYKLADYQKAFNIIKDAFDKYPDSFSDPELLLFAVNSKYQLYLDENKKIFLRSNGDTAKFFTYANETYYYGLRCDSCINQALISEKKKKNISFDVNNKLLIVRPNLLSSGRYYLKHKKYNESYSSLKLYLSEHDSLLLNNSVQYHNPTNDIVDACKLMVYSAYGCEKYGEVLKYLPYAISDSIRKNILLEIGAKSALMLNDSIKYYDFLLNGFDVFPDNEYFRANLIQYYHNTNNSERALDIINYCLESDSLNLKYLKLKGFELLHFNKLEEAKPILIHLMDLDPYDYDTASILGNMFLEEAHLFYDSSNLNINSPNYLENKNILFNLYTSAQKYYEVVMQLVPDKPELWKNGLMEIYLKLNKGNELYKLDSK